jgi:hypothetical protein
MAAPTTQLLMAGVDVSAYAIQDSWSVKTSWGRQGNTATFEFWDEHPSGTPNILPVPMNIIQFTVGGNVLFKGVVAKPTFNYEAPNVTSWSVDCRDFAYLAHMTVVTGDFAYVTADQIIKQVTKNAQIGIGVNGTNPGIQAGPLIPRYRINYKQLTDVWDQLAKYSSGGSEYGWYVDTSANLNFYSTSQIASTGITFTDQVTGNSTTTLGYINRDTIKYEWDGQNIRNSAIIRGGNILNKQIDNFVGNGIQSSWPLTFTIHTANPAFKLTVGYAGRSVATQAEAQTRGTLSAVDYLITQANTGQYFLQSNPFQTADPITGKPRGHGIPANGIPISLTYHYMAPVVARADNTVSEQAIARQLSSIGSAGVLQAYIADKNILDVGTAKARALREIQQYGTAQERITFHVTEDWPGFIQAGQIFTVALNAVPDARHAYQAPLGTLGSPAPFMALSVNMAPSDKRANWVTWEIMGLRL